MAVGKCTFCGFQQEDYKGMYYIRNDGIVNYFCGSKCMKNTFNLRRDRKRVRWTEAHRTLKASKKSASQS